MAAIKQIIKVPKDHKIKIDVPDYYAEDELLEVILIPQKEKEDYRRKIEELKKAAKDPDFLKNINE